MPKVVRGSSKVEAPVGPRFDSSVFCFSGVRFFLVGGVVVAGSSPPVFGDGCLQGVVDGDDAEHAVRGPES